MASRSEQQKQKMQDIYLANSKAIFDFLMDQGMAFEDADWCSRQSINFNDFLWYYDKAKGDIRGIRRMISARLIKVETNRKVSMFQVAENLEDEDEDDD